MPKKIVIPEMADLWCEEENRFITIKRQILVIEHSLIAISKWEAKWKKPFLSSDDKTYEEFIDYIRCMTINEVDPRIFDVLPANVYQEIDDYIGDPMTATTFNGNGPAGRKEIITSEVLYYYMLTCGIPYEFEKWHLNRLMTLIRVFSIKNGTQKKMSTREAAAYQRALNEKRLAKKRR